MNLPPRVVTKVGSLQRRVSRSRSCRVFAIILASFALSSTGHALSPPPDGGYANENTAEGDGALLSLTTGRSNTANGFQALFHNTTGYYNTATGFAALFQNSTGHDNTATGLWALAGNPTGKDNTATGNFALISNSTGHENTAVGQIWIGHRILPPSSSVFPSSDVSNKG
jgi:hypothetical protein